MATVRLSPNQEAKLRYLAAMRGTTLAEIYREAIDEYLKGTLPQEHEDAQSSAWDEAVGVIESGHSGDQADRRYTDR